MMGKKGIHWVGYELVYGRACIDYIPTRMGKFSGTTPKLNLQIYVLARDGQRMG